jgi:selenide,water dikinase
MLRHTTKLNRVGADLAGLDSVHAITDVTGFGLAGHLLEICRGSKLAAEVRWDALPLIASAVGHAQNGVWTGASTRNWASYGTSVTLPEGFPDWQRALVTDPQTSGGLLVSVAADGVDAVLAMFREAGFGEAAVVGTLAAGAPRVTVV